jgi:hypothetical protein
MAYDYAYDFFRLILSYKAHKSMYIRYIDRKTSDRKINNIIIAILQTGLFKLSYFKKKYINKYRSVFFVY